MMTFIVDMAAVGEETLIAMRPIVHVSTASSGFGAFIYLRVDARIGHGKWQVGMIEIRKIISIRNINRWVNRGMFICASVDLIFLRFYCIRVLKSTNRCPGQKHNEIVHQRQRWVLIACSRFANHFAAAAIVSIRFAFTFTECNNNKIEKRIYSYMLRTLRYGRNGIERIYAHRTMARKKVFVQISFLMLTILSFHVFYLSLRFSPFVIRFFPQLCPWPCLCVCVRVCGSQWRKSNRSKHLDTISSSFRLAWSAPKWIKCEWCCACHTKLFSFHRRWQVASGVSVRVSVCVCLCVYCVFSFYFFSFLCRYRVLTHSDDKWYCLCAAQYGHSLCTCFCTCSVQLLLARRHRHKWSFARNQSKKHLNTPKSAKALAATSVLIPRSLCLSISHSRTITAIMIFRGWRNLVCSRCRKFYRLDFH